MSIRINRKETMKKNDTSFSSIMNLIDDGLKYVLTVEINIQPTIMEGNSMKYQCYPRLIIM